MRKKIAVPAAIEIVFDIAYLCFVLIAGIVLLARAGGRTGIVLFGCMALALGAGDSFHLIPRVVAQATGRMAEMTRALGAGKLITSLTMTAFYVLLYHAAAPLTGFALSPLLTAAVYALAVVRVLLCLFPQNKWLSGGDARWALYRNIPFVLLGLIVLIVYAVSGTGALSLLWLAIVISFGCYLPVALLADRHPKLGMLMIPKTCAYIWMVCMGLMLL